MKPLPLILTLACLAAAAPASGGTAFATGDAPAPHRGVYEVRLLADIAADGQYAADCLLNVTFVRPDGSRVEVDGFYDGAADGKSIFRARAYCDRVGPWSWVCRSSVPGLDKQAGAFTVAPSTLPGKLRRHNEDPRQFAYDDGQWFLHIGDTGYRYVADSEPEWKPYIDQAAKMGATKIRTWFCRSRSGVQGLFTDDRSSLNLAYWQEIDRRVQYALDHHPQVILQLIPYGEDTQELLRYGHGDPLSRLVAQYAQARFSAFPNVLWCISNDQTIVAAADDARGVPAATIDMIGRDMAAREPWGTLITNHQARHTGYAFASAPWSDITTLEDIDQVDGALILKHRASSDRPVVNDEDRYELYRPPAHPRYYFRRLMWASLLAGGSATYGGARTYEPYNGRDCGVRGYYDLKKEGILTDGADDFEHIHRFFKQTGLTLANMHPDQNAPATVSLITGERALIAYLSNPDTANPQKANAADTSASYTLQLPPGNWSLRWFNPQTGAFFDGLDTNGLLLTAPFAGDAILLATRL